MIYLVVLLFLFLIIAFLLAFKVGLLTDKDNDFIPDELEELTEDVKSDLLDRAENVKEELKDVKEAIKNVKKQSGHVIKAAAGSKRKGRKKNAKK
jgi:chromatin segregation and condensation protein Rec8/ScpA/Scc1 (kleisin family)